jgi:urea transport system permease protein
MAALLVPGLDTLAAVLVLLLVALGLFVVFGLMGVINMAHGELFMLGAYWVFAVTSAGLPFWLAAASAPVAVGLLGLWIEALLLRHLVRRTLDTILATWGLSIVLKQVIVLGFGPQSVNVALPLDATVALGSFEYPAYRLVLMALSAAVLTGAAWAVLRTRFGLEVRAVIARPEMAAALGIDTRHVYRLSFAFGAGAAGLAGALVAPLISVDPQMGLSYLVPAFLAILVGGAGSLPGVAAGGALVGGADAALSFWVSPVVAQLVVFALAVTVIRLRPRGLFGSQD